MVRSREAPGHRPPQEAPHGHEKRPGSKWPHLAWDVDPGSVTILVQGMPVLRLGATEWEKLAGLEQIQELKDLDVDAEMRAGYRPM